MAVCPGLDPAPWLGHCAFSPVAGQEHGASPHPAVELWEGQAVSSVSVPASYSGGVSAACRSSVTDPFVIQMPRFVSAR